MEHLSSLHILCIPLQYEQAGRAQIQSQATCIDPRVEINKYSLHKKLKTHPSTFQSDIFGTPDVHLIRRGPSENPPGTGN